MKLVPSISRTLSSYPTEKVLPSDVDARAVIRLEWPSPSTLLASPVDVE